MAEDALVFSAKRRAGGVLGQQLDRAEPEIDQPARGPALGGGHPPIDERFAHMKAPLEHPHITPAQPEKLAPADRRAEGGEGNRVRQAPPGCLAARGGGINLSLSISFRLPIGAPQTRDDRVIEFGGSICDKAGANILAVPLEVFESGASAEVVRHPHRSRLDSVLPPADPSEIIVRRAEWLRENHPPGRYNIVGWNCEHAAN
jgi:hypothetical protein